MKKSLMIFMFVLNMLIAIANPIIETGEKDGVKYIMALHETELDAEQTFVEIWLELEFDKEAVEISKNTNLGFPVKSVIHYKRGNRNIMVVYNPESKMVTTMFQ